MSPEQITKLFKQIDTNLICLEARADQKEDMNYEFVFIHDTLFDISGYKESKFDSELYAIVKIENDDYIYMYHKHTPSYDRDVPPDDSMIESEESYGTLEAALKGLMRFILKEQMNGFMDILKEKEEDFTAQIFELVHGEKY